MEENVQPTKHAHTSNKETIELSESDTASDSEDEVTPAEQQSSQKNIGIPPNKTTRQLTFYDLSWKPLKTEDERLEQRKQLKQMDEKMWGGLDEEEEHRKAYNLKKIHQRQLATQRQQRCRKCKRVMVADKECVGHGDQKSINDVSGSLVKKIGINFRF